MLISTAVLLALAGIEHNGARRWIEVAGSVRWYPGPWALLALAPLQVYLTGRWRDSRRHRFISVQCELSATELTLFAMQPDAMMAWLLAITTAITMLHARPAAGLPGVGLFAVIVVALWSALAPQRFLLTTVALSSLRTMGDGLPWLAIPRASYGVNIALVLGCIAASAVGIAWPGVPHAPWGGRGIC